MINKRAMRPNKKLIFFKKIDNIIDSPNFSFDVYKINRTSYNVRVDHILIIIEYIND